MSSWLIAGLGEFHRDHSGPVDVRINRPSDFEPKFKTIALDPLQVGKTLKIPGETMN